MTPECVASREYYRVRKEHVALGYTDEEAMQIACERHSHVLHLVRSGLPLD